MPPDRTGAAVGIYKKQTIKPHHHETIHRNRHGRSLVGHAARRQEDRRRTGQFCLPHLAIRNRQPGRECRGKGHGGERAIGELTGQIAERTYRENGLPHRKRIGGSGRKGHPLLQHPGRRGLGPYSLHVANGRTGPPDASRMFRFAGPTASRLTFHHSPVS